MAPKKKGPHMEIVIERKLHFNRKIQQAVEVKKTPPPAESGNRHASTARRPLSDREKAFIRREFLKLNGVFDPNQKHCTRIKEALGDEVSVFQVSRYVTCLHNQAKSGDLEMTNRRAYLSTLRSHRNHWLTYNGEKYDEMRKKADVKPVFAAQIQRPKAGVRHHKMVR